MKTVKLESESGTLDTLQNIISGVYFSVGAWFQSSIIETGKLYSFPESVNPFLKIHIGREFPVYLDLPQNENKFALIEISKNLVQLQCDNHSIAYFAIQDGIFDIPEDFSGILFYQVSYETIFPDFAALSSLSGLFFSGYSDNITDWGNLAKATGIKLFSTTTYDASRVGQLNCQLKTLYCTAPFLNKLDASLLQDVETLFLEDGKNDTFEKIFRLPSLQRIFLQSSCELPQQSDRFLLCASLAKIIDPSFPEVLPQYGKERTYNYSEYMSNISEYINNYGTEDTGMEVKKIFETTGDYPMETANYTEIRPYGISECGSLFFRQNDDGNLVRFKLETTRGKALSALHKITGLSAGIKQDLYNESIKPELKNSISHGIEFKDPNRNEFEIKTQLFADKAKNIIVPLYNYTAKELQDQGIDAELRLDIDSPEDPRYYNASVWFTINSHGRSKWATFQISQSSYRLEPIILSIWNPEKWENEHREYKLEEITGENVASEFFAFLKSLSKYFKYEWEI